MPIVIRTTDTGAACGSIAACSALTAGSAVAAKDAAEGATGGVTAVTVTHATSAGGTRRLYHVEWVVPSGVNWDADNWVVRFNLTTANHQLTWESAHICRVDSACASVDEIGSLTGIGIALGTTGVQSATVTGVAKTPNAGDKVYIVYGFTNGQTMANSIGITPDADIDTPFTAAGGPVTIPYAIMPPPRWAD